MEEEVPSSAITVARSQTLATSNSPAANNITKNGEDTSSELGGGGTSTKSRSIHDRAALFDISNDSPIVGLAKGCSFSNGRKNMSCTWNKTPGSGEALLRRQVKTLLQRVEEEAVISKFILDTTDDGCCDEKNPPTFSALKNFFYSPMGLLGAPTPSNTPQENEGEAEADIFQVGDDLLDWKTDDKTVDSGKYIITRSLLFDFSDTEISTADCTGSSSLTPIYHGYKSSSRDSDSSIIEEGGASIRSIEVNASNHGGNEEDSKLEGEDDDNENENSSYSEEDGSYDEEGGLLGEVCEGMSRRSVIHGVGKHIRFVYDSDDEIVEEEEDLYNSDVRNGPCLGLLG